MRFGNLLYGNFGEIDIRIKNVTAIGSQSSLVLFMDQFKMSSLGFTAELITLRNYSLINSKGDFSFNRYNFNDIALYDDSSLFII